jgi:hypothetical protein
VPRASVWVVAGRWHRAQAPGAGQPCAQDAGVPVLFVGRSLGGGRVEEAVLDAAVLHGSAREGAQLQAIGPVSLRSQVLLGEVQEALRDDDELVSLQRDGEDVGGPGLQHQVDVAQGHPQGAAGGQDHQGGGGVLQGEQRAGVGAGGLVQSGALGRAGPCGLRCPPGLRVGAGAVGPDAHHVDACGLPGPGDAVGRARVTGR